MRYVYLEKENLGKFIELLKKEHKVMGPIKKENQFIFSEIVNSEDLALEYKPTILPPKKYFLPQKEKLGSFNMGDVKMKETTVDIESTVIFAAHTCDIDGMECLEAVFYKDPADPYYKKRSKAIMVIGYECMAPCDDYATCVTMDTHKPKAGHDVMITDVGKKYILHINSKAGDELINDNPIFKKDDEDKIKAELKAVQKKKLDKFDVKLKAKSCDIQEIFKRSFNSFVWEKVGEKCVSCGNCTAVCPTCYCFDVYDEVELDISGGERKRVWDSCQLEEFAEVASGENFRKKRSSRQKHRYYRKFDYPVDKYNKFFCTGCGRCTRTCMADISLIETVNKLTKEK